jgi:hypothetical protein
MVYCNCDGKNEVQKRENEDSKIPEGFDLIFLSSCGIVSTGFYNGKKAGCLECENGYAFKEKDKTLAKKVYDLAMKS